MTRRDTIIIATLVNAGLLACLFVTATRQEDTFSGSLAESYEIAQIEDKEDSSKVFEPKVESQKYPNNSEVKEEFLPVHDEVDQALREFLPDSSYNTATNQNYDHEIGLEADLNPWVKEPAPALQQKPAVAASTHATPFKAEETKNSVLSASAGSLVEIKVKKGDMLAKIAKANGTTVKAIKDANQLTSDNLRVGQLLKVPTGNITSSQPVVKPTSSVTSEVGSEQFYTVQSGDNPWRIAKKFHVKFEDILKLNNMTEEKAKNLKVGQEIRVK